MARAFGWENYVPVGRCIREFGTLAFVVNELCCVVGVDCAKK